MTEETTAQVKKPLWKRKRFIIPVVLVIIIAIASSNSSSKKSTDTSATSPTTATAKPGKTTTTSTSTSTTVPVRKVTGTATTLGAGTFAGGKDVPDGFYDVTTTAGQSGNFTVSGTDSYNEILGVSDGQGVPKVRTKVSDGDNIQISGLSKVTFSPVSSPLVTAYSAQTLYTGTFTVGQDIGPGRYLAAPGGGQSGNFMVSGDDSYNEILGSTSAGGVPSVTVTLKKGDEIIISSLSQVTLTPAS